MKKASKKRASDELRAEYDLSRLKGGVRGKYYDRAMAGANVVILDPDVALAFPDSVSANRALRMLKEVAAKSSKRSPKPAATRSKTTR